MGQKIFFEGQIYDAFSLLISLVGKAEKSIVLIDNYVDVGTLNILAKKKDGVDVTIYTVRRTRLAGQDIANFNSQYPTLTVNYTGAFHDRFLIIDEETAYHIGASLKDAGKKCFGISRIEDAGIISDILQRLEIETEGSPTLRLGMPMLWKLNRSRQIRISTGPELAVEMFSG